MKYALGNMLNGAGGLNADQLALDLQFAVDKTLTARKGPTPTFTRASSGTFVGSDGLIQTAANNVARFDHDPVTLASRGLLIEDSRTNLLLRSEELNNTTYWVFTRASATANQTSSPDNTNTADNLIADTTAASTHRVDRPTITLALNTVYTVSIFAKASEYTGIALGVGLSAIEGVRFSLVGAGTATTVLGSGHTGTIQQLANGWYRCTATFTSDAATATHRVAIYVGQNGTTFTYTGDGTSGIFIWGAQLEAGSFATSYIPTTTASVVRSADVCSITGANFTSFYNQPEGTMIINGDSAGSNGGRWCSTSPTRAFELSGKTTLSYFESSGGTVNSIGAITLPTKFGLACKLNDFQGVRSGILGGADAIATMPSPATLHIGNLLGSSDWLNGCIKGLTYYRKRLPNSKLQSLTA